MEKIIEISFALIMIVICIIKLKHDIKEDRKNDLKYKLEEGLSLYSYKNDPCTEKSEHCDYCGIDDCIFHPNNE